MNPEVTEQRAQDCLDGNLSDLEKRVFFEEAKNDPAIMRTYCIAASMDMSLRRFAQGEVNLRLEGGEQITRKKGYPWSLGAAAAVLLIGAMILSFVMITEREQKMSFEVSPGSIFTVSHEGGERIEEGSLFPGSRVVIKTGTAKFLLADGVESVVQGPADLTVHGDGLVFLENGIAWFRVPEEGEGFRLRTRHSEVVDLGTEFGVVSQVGRYDEIHLFEGEIEVRSLHANMEEVNLNERGARMVDVAGSLRKLELKENIFEKALPKYRRLPVRWTTVGGVDLKRSDLSDSTSPIVVSAGQRDSSLGLNGFFPEVSLDLAGDRVVIAGRVTFSGIHNVPSASLNFGLLRNEGDSRSPIWSGCRMSCAGPEGQSHLRWLESVRHLSPASGVGGLLWKSQKTKVPLEEYREYQFFLSVTKAEDGHLIESSLGDGKNEFAKASFLYESRESLVFNSVALLANQQISAAGMSFRDLEVVKVFGHKNRN